MRAFWIQPTSKTALTTALEHNLTNILFTDAQTQSDWSSLARFDSTLINPDNTFSDGILAPVHSAEDVTQLMSLAGIHEIIIMDATDWKLIPAENLIAAYQTTETKLFAVVETAQDAQAMFEMLQVGVDGCVLRTDDVQQIITFAGLKARMHQPSISPESLSVATITEVKPVGTGERVCIDTCSLLSEDEGLLVGSSSRALFHVLSEAAVTSYVPSRPFRINAGPVHSYCATPGGKTKYLCELRAGDEVLVMGPGGQTRTAVVGRAKIETRPLLMISAKVDETTCTVFVQNAETVRLSVRTGDKLQMSSVTQLKQGDQLIVKTESGARHVGMAIEENLVEN